MGRERNRKKRNTGRDRNKHPFHVITSG